jgi:hypothetical protein
MRPPKKPEARPLDAEERTFFRDKLRGARYAALADSEGFNEICFAIEALGQRLDRRQGSLGTYRQRLRRLADHSPVLSELALTDGSQFTCFDALYEAVQSARNDAMHTGAYARHVTDAALELCLGLEEALMEQEAPRRTSVRDFMVKAPVFVEPWNLVAHARQLMLTHSFSFLPILVEGRWNLVSELALARYLNRQEGRSKLLAKTLLEVTVPKSGPLLELQEAVVVDGSCPIRDLLNLNNEKAQPFLWLVADSSNHLVGVLSPFELM